MSLLTTTPARLQRPATIVRHETVRRGEVVGADAQVRWVRRPQPRDRGWAGALLEVNGTLYQAEAHFHADDDGRSWIIVDLVKAADGKHIRVILGQGVESCDCEAATYRPAAVCKHRAAVAEALDHLDALEQAERLLANARNYHEQLELAAPPF